MKKLVVSIEDLKYNLNQIDNIIKKEKKEIKIIAVVKSNGMGLDLIKYSKFLNENHIDALAVANIEEAVELRKNGIDCEILMLTPSKTKEELEILIQNDIIITLDDLDSMKNAEEICDKLNKRIKAHIKIDTGFSRYGILYYEKEKVIDICRNANYVEIEGIYTHLSKAIDEEYSNIQYDRFCKVLNFLEENGISIKYRHVCNSTGFLKYPYMWQNSVRLGSCIQGRTLVYKDRFRQIGKFVSNIVEVKNIRKNTYVSYGNIFKSKKDMKIAILPVGYMDGFNYSKKRDDFTLKNNIYAIWFEIKKLFKDNSLKVEIDNTKYKVIGRLGMYHSVIDISKINSIKDDTQVLYDIKPLDTNSSIRREYT